jgi:hypothetical protein
MPDFRFDIINGQVAFDRPAFEAECLKTAKGFIQVLSLEKAISNKQMAFFHGKVIPLFVEHTGDSPAYWETKLKVEQGSKWFTPETVIVNKWPVVFVPSKTKLTTRQFMEWLQNITDFGLTIDVKVPPPDKDWKKNGFDDGQPNPRRT